MNEKAKKYVAMFPAGQNRISRDGGLRAHPQADRNIMIANDDGMYIVTSKTKAHKQLAAGGALSAMCPECQSLKLRDACLYR